MGANPHANGGLLLHDLKLPDFRDYALKFDKPGVTTSSPTPSAWFDTLELQLTLGPWKNNPGDNRARWPDPAQPLDAKWEGGRLSHLLMGEVSP